jgi:hypothetical protein
MSLNDLRIPKFHPWLVWSSYSWINVIKKEYLLYFADTVTGSCTFSSSGEGKEP